MNIQLVKIVHIMIMLKRVRSQLRKIWITETIINIYNNKNKNVWLVWSEKITVPIKREPKHNPERTWAV